MNLILVIPCYLAWHYTFAFRNIFGLWKNFSWFTLRFFSVSKLLRTIFSPFKRLTEQSSGFGFQKMLESFVVNILMRIVGFFMRSILIIMGLIFLVLVSILTILFTVVWIVLPFVVGLVVVYSLIDFFKFITL
ncbi:MAG: ABC-type siderophore export system fused ATPase/permease subunit [Candidatus Paceibacteria bacterium]|jgi:ABC-type siderophore export system fused ATPase/permease subunit